MGDFSADIQYLMKDEIGKVISEGLSVLYEQNPAHPIDYLAKWFLNYAATQKNREQAEIIEKQRNELIAKYKERAEVVKKEQEIKKQQQQEADKVEENYRKEIVEHEYHHELLPHSLPNFIEKQKGFSGVYIGHFDHPTRQITDEQEDELAHIDFSAPKQINYIGASDSHHFMIGKSLPPRESEIAQTKTVTYTVFDKKEEEPQVDADGNPIEVVEKPNYLYVSDVTTEDRMYYFRLPRLGAFLACPLVYESCLNPEAFDAGVEGRKNFYEAQADFESRKKQKIEERDEALAQLEEGTEEYQATVDKYNEEIQAMEPPVEAPFLVTKKEFVVCIDTLGQDRPISEEDRKYVEELVKLFANSWQEKEQQLLSKDINKQLELTKDIEYTEVVEEYTKRLEEEADNREVPPEADDFEREYIAQTARVEFLRDLLMQDEYKNKLKELVNFRVLKFPGIIQNALYLIGYEKEQVDLPGTNVLNWKEARHHIDDADLFEKLKAYEWVGPKHNPVEKTAFINRIQRRVDEIYKNIDEVDKYNLGLGVLLKFLKNLTDLRIRDIRKRRAEKARLREARNKAIEDKAEWERAREEAVAEALAKAQEEAAAKQAEIDAQKQKDAAADGDGDGGDGDQGDAGDNEEVVPVEFNKEEFLAEWDSVNKMPEIPEEVVEDIDLDLEPEEEPAQ